MREAKITGPDRISAVFAAFLTLALVCGSVPFAGQAAFAQTNDRGVAPDNPVGGTVPGRSLGAASDSELWRDVRGGIKGNVSIPDKQAGQMIQSQGEEWRAWRNGPLTVWGGTGLLVMIGLVALFFLVRGRIRIDAGPSGKTIQRFNDLERFAHWLTAVCFVVLALTGLNLLYGKYVLLPVLGPAVFAAITLAGKYAHNFLAFGFLAGVVLMLVIWARHNILTKYDLQWLAKGGGLFVKGVHPPSEKFNFGQKVIFWLVVLSGLSLGLSGIALMFPFEFSIFAPTFKVLNVFGAGLATELTPVQEMQLAQLWHAVVAMVMIAVIIAHIYIGSLGMEGAFAAMGSGQVDENWAREHHNLWVEEVKATAGAKGKGGSKPKTKAGSAGGAKPKTQPAG